MFDETELAARYAKDRTFTAAERRLIVTVCRVCPQYQRVALPAAWIAEADAYRQSEDNRARLRSADLWLEGSARA